MSKYFKIVMILMLLMGSGFSSQIFAQKTDDPVKEEPVSAPIPEAGEGDQPADDTSKDSEDSKDKASVPNPFNFNLGIGQEIIDGVPYISIAMQPDLALGKFGIGLDVTLRINDSFSGLYKPDWDEWQDIVSKINYIRWDKKGAPLFIKLGLLDDVYLGHGSIFYRYSNKVFLPSVRRIGAQFDLDLKKFGWELFDDDIIDNRIFGGRLYFRPFSESKIFFLNKLALGVTGAADIDLDPVFSPEKKVVLAGADLDIPLVKAGEFFTLILYTDVVKNFHFNQKDEGLGITPGFLFTLFGFNFIGEYHIYKPHFDGAYFNAFYDIERNFKLVNLESRTQSAEGWSIKMAKSILGLVSVGFDMGANRDENPDMHFEVVMLKKIMDKIKFSMYYDKMNIPDVQDAFRIMALNAKMTTSVDYSLSPNVDLLFVYQKSFVVDLTAPTGVRTVNNSSIQTKIHF